MPGLFDDLIPPGASPAEPASKAGLFDDLIPTKPAAAKSTPVMDLAKSAGTGVIKGGIGMVGLPGDLAHLATHAATYLGANPKYEDWTKRHLYGSPDVQKGVEENITGPLYEPQTTAGRYAQTMGEFAPAALAGPGGVARRLIQGAAIPGAASEAAGELTQGSTVEPYARALAGLGAGVGAARIITPNPASDVTRRAVDVLQNEGVTGLTAGQRTGSSGLKKAESVFADAPLSGTSTAGINERGAEQFTQAALNRIGVPRAEGVRAYPEVLERAANNLSNEYQRLTAAHDLRSDPQLQNAVTRAQTRYESNVGPNGRVPLVEQSAENIRQRMIAQNGSMTGAQYQAMRSDLAQAARGASDDQAARALSGMREALDDAMERSIAAKGPAASQDLTAFRAANQRYKDMLVLQRAMGAAGEKAASGLITPAQLHAANKAIYGERAVARGEGSFSDLARAGNTVMAPLPDSGTAWRLAWLGELPLAGMLGFGHEGDALGTLMGLGGGAAAQAAMSRALLSRPAQAYLGNQLLPQGPGRQASRYSKLYAASLAARPPSDKPRNYTPLPPPSE